MQRLLLFVVLLATAVSGCATVGPFGIAAAPAGAPGAKMTRMDVTLTNRGRKVAKRVTVRCRFFDGDGQPLEVGAAYFSNLAGGGSAIEPVTVQRGGVARGDCAVAPKAAKR